MQHSQKRVAPMGHKVEGAVDGHVQPGIGNEPPPEIDQPGRQKDDKGHDGRAAYGDLAHEAATIWEKAAKPSDMRPARMKPIPSPRRPAGRSA